MLISVLPGLPQAGPRSRPRRSRRPPARSAVEHRDDRREPAVHVDPVVAVADRLVEGGQRRRLLVDPRRRPAAARRRWSSIIESVSVDPASVESSRWVARPPRRRDPARRSPTRRSDAPAQGRRVDRSVPQPVSSSSSRRSVTENPAISRLVM